MIIEEKLINFLDILDFSFFLNLFTTLLFLNQNFYCAVAPLFIVSIVMMALIRLIVHV